MASAGKPLRQRDPDGTDPHAVYPDAPSRGVTEVDALVTEPGGVRMSVRVLAGPRAGAEFALASVVTVGRGTDNEISIPDVSVSRQHLRLEPDGRGGITVTDLGSGNGTLVNEVRVTTATVRHGDEIAAGDTVLQVVEGGVPVVRRRKSAAPPQEALDRGSSARASAGPEPAVVSSRAEAPRNRRLLVYVAFAALLLPLAGYGVLKQLKGGVAVIGGGDSGAALGGTRALEEARKLANRHQWSEAVKVLEESFPEAEEGSRPARFLKVARDEALSQRAVEQAQELLRRGDFVGARMTASRIPELADVEPQAQELLSRIGPAMTDAVEQARGRAASGDKEGARGVVDRVLAADPEHHAALVLRAELDQKPPPSKPAAVGVVSKPKVEETVGKEAAPVLPSGPAVAAYLSGDIDGALALAQDDAALHQQLNRFRASYREGMQRAADNRVPEALKALGIAGGIDREIARGRPSQPGQSVNATISKMSYLLGLDSKGDAQLHRAAAHFRAALQADASNDLAKRQLEVTYKKARELYMQAYVGKASAPDVAIRQLRIVRDTLPEGDEHHEKAARLLESMGAGGK